MADIALQLHTAAVAVLLMLWHVLQALIIDAALQCTHND